MFVPCVVKASARRPLSILIEEYTVAKNHTSVKFAENDLLQAVICTITE